MATWSTVHLSACPLTASARRVSRRPVNGTVRHLVIGRYDLAANAGVRVWVGRGVWAVADQALFAGSNFVLNLLLARWLHPDGYGAFATAFAVFLLISTVHAGFFTDPMVVFGSGRFYDRLDRYVSFLIRTHWFFGVGACCLFLVTWGVFILYGQQTLASAFAGLAVAAPLILFMWLCRRICYVLLAPQLSVAGGALYLLLLLGGAVAAAQLGTLSPGSVFLIMGASAVLSGALVLHRWRGMVAGASSEVHGSEVVGLHWDYGRWSALSLFMGALPTQLPYALLPAFHGLAASGTYRALSNLLMPLLHANTALGGLVLPLFVRWRDTGRLRKGMGLWLGYLLAASAGYWLLLALFHEPLVRVVYGGRYAANAGLLVLLGAVPIAGSFALVFGAALRALERSDLVARAVVIEGLAGGLVCALLIPRWGLMGAVLAPLVAVGCGAVAFALAWRTASAAVDAKH